MIKINNKTILFVMILVVFSLFLSKINYLIFHIFIEFSSIIVAVSAFLLIFINNNVKFEEKNFYKIMATILMTVAIVDFLHIISYKGMNIIGNITANEPTQLWVIGRYIESVELFFLFFYKKKFKYKTLIFINFILVIITILFVFVYKIFPAAYIEGEGLSKFKIISEYVVIIFLLIVLYKTKKEIKFKNNEYLQLAIFLTIIQEIFFTLYIDVYGIFILMGHITKLTAAIYFYRFVNYGLIVIPFEKINIENGEKVEFLSNISHEIRTPLNGIIGFVDMLKITNLNSEQKEYISYIDESTGYLMKIMNNLLEFFKIENSKNKIEYSKFDLLNSIRVLITNSEIRCEEKKIQFIFEYDKNIPQYIYSHQLSFLKIMQNLIDNSIKYTEKGYVKFIIKMINNKNNDYIDLEISVIDTGIGLEEKFKERIFDEFQQEKSYLDKKYNDSGLGLLIVKKMVDLLNGKIEVFSEKNFGTKFTVVLNVKTESKISLEKIENRFVTSNPLLNDFKIICAEDDEVNQRIILKIAQKENWNFKIVKNGLELLEELMINEYNLVLLDIQMPVLNGIEVTKVLRANREFDKLTIIGISAFASEKDIYEAKLLGMNEYIPKPYKVNEIVKIVEKYKKER